MSDRGIKASLAGLEAHGTRRTPDTILRDEVFQDSPEQRARFRPDILLMEDSDHLLGSCKERNPPPFDQMCAALATAWIPGRGRSY